MHFPENISGSEPRYEDSPSRLGNKGVAAFDVFETALVRAVGSPQAVFRLLGQRLAAQGLISCPPEIFARARIQAESRAHNYSGGGISATLAGIYAELGSALSDLGATPEQLMQAECRLEAELLRPVPETRRRILAARQQGKRIVFISDMYLPADFIFGQLLKHQLAEPGDGCYVSSEQHLWKCDGGLFREVLKRENILPGATCFLGNNLAVDVGPAVQLGISAEYFPSGNLNRYEEILESQSWATGGLTSALAGASRLARLNVMADSVKTAAIRDFAASVVAPTLISYTIWLLRQAQKRGLTRLYFLARDGEVLLKLAKILAPKLQINCELRYLYGSRKAWGMAAIVNGDADELAWLLEGDPGPDLSRLLSRLDIAPTAIQSALEKLGFDAASWNKRFSTAELARIKSREFLELIRSPVVKTSVRRRDLLLAYLEQEGLLMDSQYGLVDVGWHATLQDCLARILATRHKEIGMGFYFGLTGYQTAEKFGAKHAYFMDAQRQLGPR